MFLELMGHKRVTYQGSSNTLFSVHLAVFAMKLLDRIVSLSSYTTCSINALGGIQQHLLSSYFVVSVFHIGLTQRETVKYLDRT
jgi:hypothetical protein